MKCGRIYTNFETVPLDSICRMLSSSSLAKKSTLSSVDGRIVGNSSLIGAGERILLSL